MDLLFSAEFFAYITFASSPLSEEGGIAGDRVQVSGGSLDVSQWGKPLKKKGDGLYSVKRRLT
jgi:hypothetical protein